MQWRSVFYPPQDYSYFAQPPAFEAANFVGRLNVLKAAWMADAATLAYARSGPARIVAAQLGDILQRAGFMHWDLLGDWSGGSTATQAYFAYTNEFAVLTFRGTEKDDWRDMAADLAAWLVPVDESGAGGKTIFDMSVVAALLEPAAPAVHYGFQAALSEVWDQAAQLLTEYRAATGNEIFFTGHSLGAALATLAIARFNGGNASLYTFGSPRVGNRAFVATLRDRASLGHYRLVDNYDLVTRVPPALRWYSHAANTLYRIEAGGCIGSA